MGTVNGAARPVAVILAAGLAKRYGGCKPLAPIGLHGEAVIDLTAADAVGAGFGEVVLVLGPVTGPAVEYHVRRVWPDDLRVQVAYQQQPLGTAHAVLCARRQIGDRPFAVVNGDDVYGVGSFCRLREHFETSASEHALVAFALGDSIVGDTPVTRGVVHASPDGMLQGIDERKHVRRLPDGTFAVGDGRQPDTLGPDTPVSVNLWGFRPAIWAELAAAVTSAHPYVDDHGTVDGATGSDGSGTEVLLPEVVGTMAAGTSGRGPQMVRVLSGQGTVVGVTHAADLPHVRAELATMVAVGDRTEQLWPARS